MFKYTLHFLRVFVSKLRSYLMALLSPRLVLHQSVKVQNTRTAASSSYFVIHYFIHGK